MLPSTSMHRDFLTLAVLPFSNLARRVAETLPQEVLAKMHAPPKPAYPVLEPADLAQFDAFLMGIPTRFGNFPAQWKVRNMRVLHLLGY